MCRLEYMRIGRYRKKNILILSVIDLPDLNGSTLNKRTRIQCRNTLIDFEGDMMKDIILMALEHEAPKMAKWENVFFTGVGKVNAALTAGKLIERYQPRTVWNFGTAGGIKLGSWSTMK